MLSRSNYESYFLDYHEGNLTDSQRRELMSFLELNPDLKEEFESFVQIVVEPDTQTVFTGKESLRKKERIHSGNYKTWLVALCENDLNAEEKEELNRFLEINPAIKPELELIRLTKLIPDTKIVFKDKTSLKRGGKIISFSTATIRTWAIAASIALLLISVYVYRQQHSTEPQMAEKSVSPESVSPVQVLPNDSTQVNHPVPDKKIKLPIPSDHVNGIVPHLAHEKKLKKPDVSPVERTETPSQSQFAQHSDPVNSSASNDSVRKEMNPAPKEEFAQNRPATTNKDYPQQNLSDIFSDQDMKDLGLESKPEPQKDKSAFWTLASKGASKLTKATGKDISIDKSKDVEDNTTTYALALGKFSISHRKSEE